MAKIEVEMESSLSKNHCYSTTITDLNVDSLAHCCSYLNLRDISNIAATCKSLKRAAYSDSVWQRFFRERWPREIPKATSLEGGVREAYLSRRTALYQLKFCDCAVTDFYAEPKHFDNLLLHKDNIIFSQSSSIHVLKTGRSSSGGHPAVTLNDHKARITSMRLFPLAETSLFRSETQNDEDALVTSSSDHSIRLWWKGSCQRCFRGHNGPVSTLSDKLLGDCYGKVLASGGEDGTVRLWNFSSSGRRGQQALKATLYGHERPIKFMSIAGHKTSLLVSISTDSKMRVWDTTASPSVRSSCCVGMTSVLGKPVGIKCQESLLYIAAGSSVVTIDLRTMQKVATGAIHQTKLCSFSILPSKSLICTGGIDKAMLWDIRRSQESRKSKPIAELEGHTGPVTLLHMDPYKIVTGGPRDVNLNVWEADTGTQTNSLPTPCWLDEDARNSFECSALAVNGCRVVIATRDEAQGLLRHWDFSDASCPILKNEKEHASKFWDQQSDTDTDSSHEWRDSPV